MAVLKSRSEAVVPTYLGWIGTYALLIAIIVACDAFGLLQQQGGGGPNAPGLRMHLADRACAQIIKALQNCLTRGPETP
jgi:hypothetical protein